MAGEIQLNSTTMATESSGSITAQLDTIRPNTTNGSLTLQGDSSDAGVTGLTIDSSGNATFAQTISGGTIGSSVVFPAGHIISHSTPFAKTGSSSIETTSTSFAESGIEVNITPKLSSADSRIVIQFFTGYPRTIGSSATLLQYTCRRATATSTAYASATQLNQDNYFFPNSSGTYWSQHATFIDSGSYSAGTQYFYQIYFLSSGGQNVQLVRDNGTATMLAYEVKI